MFRKEYDAVERRSTGNVTSVRLCWGMVKWRENQWINAARPNGADSLDQRPVCRWPRSPCRRRRVWIWTSSRLRGGKSDHQAGRQARRVWGEAGRRRWSRLVYLSRRRPMHQAAPSWFIPWDSTKWRPQFQLSADQPTPATDTANIIVQLCIHPTSITLLHRLHPSHPTGI